MKVLKLLEESEGKKGGKTRTRSGKSFKTEWGGGRESMGLSLLFGDKQVQESSFVICSVVGLLRVCILARRNFEVFLQHMSICGLYSLIVVLLGLNNLKAKFPVEVNC